MNKLQVPECPTKLPLCLHAQGQTLPRASTAGIATEPGPILIGSMRMLSSLGECAFARLLGILFHMHIGPKRRGWGCAGRGDARTSYLHPTSSQKSYEFTEILRVHRNPTSSQKSYEFTEILRAHRNPSSSQKSFAFTEILRVHINPTSSQKSFDKTEILRQNINPLTKHTSFDRT